MPSHYEGIIPFTYHTSEMMFWNIAIAVSFYLLILKLPFSTKQTSPGEAESEKEQRVGLTSRSKFAAKRVLCDFLAKSSLRKTATLAGLFILPSIYIWQNFSIVTLYLWQANNGRPDLAVLFIDAELVLVVYAISIAVARSLCKKICHLTI
jgi:hypothetical protein